jgi:hypothetical protein
MAVNHANMNWVAHGITMPSCTCKGKLNCKCKTEQGKLHVPSKMIIPVFSPCPTDEVAYQMDYRPFVYTKYGNKSLEQYHKGKLDVTLVKGGPQIRAVKPRCKKKLTPLQKEL